MPFAHEIDVAHVLFGEFRHGNVEDVELLASDEVEKQIKRSFKTLKKDLQRFGRNEEVFGTLPEGLSVKTREHVLPHLVGRGKIGRKGKRRLRHAGVSKGEDPGKERDLSVPSDEKVPLRGAPRGAPIPGDRINGACT